MNDLNSYEIQLLEGWEAVYKRSQLTLWILLALNENPKRMAHIKDYITHATCGVLEADDKSMYRALRRFHDAELVHTTTKPSTKGPDVKVYSLTPIGSAVLNQFIARNVLPLLENRTIHQKLNASS